MVGAEGPQQGGHGLRAQRVEEAEGDPSRLRVGVGAHGFGRPLHLAQRALHGGEEAAARGRERDRTALPGEERDAEVEFEPDHGPAQRGLRHAQLARRPRDVLVPRHGGELGQPGRQHRRPGSAVQLRAYVCCVTER
jgi:hypothetical protein